MACMAPFHLPYLPLHAFLHFRRRAALRAIVHCGKHLKDFRGKISGWYRDFQRAEPANLAGPIGKT